MQTPFGKKIKIIRINRQLLMKDMARELGKKPSYLSAIENGKKNIPSKLVDDIAKYFMLSDAEKHELHLLAEESNKEFTINIEGMDDLSRNTVANFARKFSNMDEEQRESLRKLLEGIDDSTTP